MDCFEKPKPGRKNCVWVLSWMHGPEFMALGFLAFTVWGELPDTSQHSQHEIQALNMKQMFWGDRKIKECSWPFSTGLGFCSASPVPRPHPQASGSKVQSHRRANPLYLDVNKCININMNKYIYMYIYRPLRCKPTKASVIEPEP